MTDQLKSSNDETADCDHGSRTAELILLLVLTGEFIRTKDAGDLTACEILGDAVVVALSRQGSWYSKLSLETCTSVPAADFTFGLMCDQGNALGALAEELRNKKYGRPKSGSDHRYFFLF